MVLLQVWSCKLYLTCNVIRCTICHVTHMLIYWIVRIFCRLPYVTNKLNWTSSVVLCTFSYPITYTTRSTNYIYTTFITGMLFKSVQNRKQICVCELFSNMYLWLLFISIMVKKINSWRWCINIALMSQGKFWSMK